MSERSSSYSGPFGSLAFDDEPGVHVEVAVVDVHRVLRVARRGLAGDDVLPAPPSVAVGLYGQRFTPFGVPA